MTSNEEQLLMAVARRSWAGYVASQLAECEAALELWQQRAEQHSGEFCAERIQHELAYYTRQVARWGQSLDEVRAEVEQRTKNREQTSADWR